MSDLLLDELPTRWHGHEIVPDFRPMVWLVNSYVRGSVNTDPVGFARSAIWRFYKDPHCFLTDDQMLFEGYQHLLGFYQAGEKAASGGDTSGESEAPATLPFDYQCDAPYIVAAFQRLYGIDLTTEHVHWFRFRALLRGVIGEDCMFSRIIDWRTADLSDMNPEKRRIYEEQRERFALPAELRGVQHVRRPSKSTMQASLPVSVAAERAPIPCPHCGRPLPVWAEPHATATGVWVKCKIPPVSGKSR